MEQMPQEPTLSNQHVDCMEPRVAMARLSCYQNVRPYDLMFHIPSPSSSWPSQKARLMQSVFAGSVLYALAIRKRHTHHITRIARIVRNERDVPTTVTGAAWEGAHEDSRQKKRPDLGLNGWTAGWQIQGT